MIVLPFFAGIAAILQQIVEGAAIGALFGALFGGAISGGGEVVTGIQVYGEVNQKVIENVVVSSVDGAIDGAVGGAVTGGLFGLAGSAFHPVFAMIDDFFRSIFGWLDDAARSVAGAIDDAFTGIKNTAKSVVNGTRARINHVRNVRNAHAYRNLPAANATERYVYVMDDSANGLHKIGMTTRKPEVRLSEISRDAKSKLNYVCIIRTDKGSGLESLLKGLFKSQKTPHPTPKYDSTEWFILSAAQVAAACSH